MPYSTIMKNLNLKYLQLSFALIVFIPCICIQYFMIVIGKYIYLKYNWISFQKPKADCSRRVIYSKKFPASLRILFTLPSKITKSPRWRASSITGILFSILFILYFWCNDTGILKKKLFCQDCWNAKNEIVFSFTRFRNSQFLIYLFSMRPLSLLRTWYHTTDGLPKSYHVFLNYLWKTVRGREKQCLYNKI